MVIYEWIGTLFHISLANGFTSLYFVAWLRGANADLQPSDMDL